MHKILNHQWSALSLAQAEVRFAAPITLHRISHGIALVSEQGKPGECYYVDCAPLFGHITEHFEGSTRYHLLRNRLWREQLTRKINAAIARPPLVYSTT